MVKTFYVDGCPRHYDCSSQSFKKAACKGPTKAEARTKLIRHLMLSGSHQLREKEAVQVAEEAEHQEWDEFGPLELEAEANPPDKARLVPVKTEESTEMTAAVAPVRDVPDKKKRKKLLEEALALTSLQAPTILQGQQLALVMFTSGSTGKPKAVPLTRANVSSSLRACVATYQLQTEDKTLHTQPLCTIGGLMTPFLAVLASGGTVVFAPFDAARHWFRVIAHDITCATP